MNFTPLIPLPANSQSSEATSDPFDDLLNQSSPHPHTQPLFHSPRPDPIQIPHASAESHSHSHSRSQSVSTEDSSSDFGAFVSVSPKDDPLASFSPMTSPSDESGAPPIEALASLQFVDEAKKRNEHSQQRILHELLEHEQHGHEHRPRFPARFSQHSLSSKSTMGQVEHPVVYAGSPPAVPTAKHAWDLLAEAVHVHPTHHHVQTASEPSVPSIPEALSTPPLTPKPTSDQKPLSPDHRNKSLPVLSSSPPTIGRASSFSQRLSSTLPKKWSMYLSSSLPASIEHDEVHEHHTHSPPLADSPPANGRPHPKPHHRSSIPSAFTTFLSAAPITHTSPFAAHTHTAPPSGAPGFAGDNNWDKGYTFHTAHKLGHPVKLHGRMDNTEPVLSSEIVETIRTHLPPLFRLSRTWSLLYSLDQHGISLSTFYTRVAAHEGGCLLVIRDASDACFGVWVGDGVRRSHAYYGSGESFLWKEIPEGEPDGPGVKVYKWSGKNDYVALCESDYISFGGGDGKYGLYLDSMFSDGSSARCLTFDNEVLCGNPATDGRTTRFECVGIEAWGVSH